METREKKNLGSVPDWHPINVRNTTALTGVNVTAHGPVPPCNLLDPESTSPFTLLLCRFLSLWLSLRTCFSFGNLSSRLKRFIFFFVSWPLCAALFRPFSRVACQLLAHCPTVCQGADGLFSMVFN